MESDKDLEKGDFKIVPVDNMEGFVSPTSNPCVVYLHEEVFDFSCYLDDTEKVVNTILSMAPPSQLNTAFKSVKSHLQAAREFGIGAHLTTGAALVTIPDIVPPIPLVPGQPKSIKRKPTATVSKPPQSQTEPPAKDPKVTGEASGTPAKKKGPLGKGHVPKEGEITGDTEQPIEEGAFGGPESEAGAADSTDKPGMF